jgi:hypothetical protein
MIKYPTGFDPEETHVICYLMPDGMVISAGGKFHIPPLPEGAKEITRQEYDAAYVVWQEAWAAHRAAALLADEERLAAAKAAALGHMRALMEHMPTMPVDTARLLSSYDGPWPVEE